MRACLSSLRAQDFAFALAVRLECRDAIEHFETEYMSLLRSCAERITRDEGRITALTKEVFDELHGSRDVDGRRRSLFDEFDGQVSLITWLREVMLQREMGGPPPAVPLLLQPASADSDAKREFLDALDTAAWPSRRFKFRLWQAPLALVILILISVIATATRRQTRRLAAPPLSAFADNRRASGLSPRQSQRFSAPSRSATVDNRGDGGILQSTLLEASPQFEQSTFTCASYGLGLASTSSGPESRQADRFAGDIESLFSRAEAGARFAMATGSPIPASAAPAQSVATAPRRSVFASRALARPALSSAASKPYPFARVDKARYATNRARLTRSTLSLNQAVVTKWRKIKRDTSARHTRVVEAYRSGNSRLDADSRKTGAASGVALSDAVARKPITVAAPEDLTRWMLTSRGVIARSNDGVSWQPLLSGTDHDLIAGTAPSAEVCWIVGRAGTILRTTDGEQWESIPSPTRADLLSISATNEYTAIVLTADGRRFTTNNGGKTWEPTQN